MSNTNYDGHGCVPDSTRDETIRSAPKQNNGFQSPLLKRFPINKRPNNFDPSYNQTNSFNGVRNRLGPKCPYLPKNANDDRFAKEQGNRKRPYENSGPMVNKRRWKPYYNDPNYNQDSPQNRINRIRTGKKSNYQQQKVSHEPANFTITAKNELNDTQESDVADITIQVINQNAKPIEDNTVTRFKMVLDDKTQKAIKLIQQKRKEKQVIFPLPVTPTVTGISMHERFSML